MSYDLGTAHGKIVLDYDSDRAIGRAEKDIDKLERKAKDTNGVLGKLGKTIGVIGQGAKFGGMAVALSQAAISAAALGIQILGMVPQLASIASLSAALPGFYAGAAATALTLKAAFAGVGDAIKFAFDPKKTKEFEAALKQLSPEAARFVSSIHDAAPALQSFQKQIQETFFQSSHLADIFPSVVRAMGTVRPQVLGLAADLGEVTRKLANFATSADSVKFVSDSIQVFRDAVSGAGQPLVNLLIGLRDVGDVGLPLLSQMADAVNILISRFGTWLSTVANDGRLQVWIDTAISTLKTLGDIVGNLGKILLPILQAAQSTGGGLLNTIAMITGEFAKFLNSAEGSAALTSLFSGLVAIAKSLTPILTTLVSVLAKALGPAMEQIATTFGPILLQVIQELAPAVGPLVAALANLLTALAPLLPPIAGLVRLLAGVLTNVIGNLTGELGPLVSILGDTLVKAFQALSPVIDVMAQGLPLAAQAGAELAEAFAPLAPVIVELASAIADSLVQVAPQLLDSIKSLVPVFVDFAKAMSGELIVSLKILIAVLPALVKIFAVIAPILVQASTVGIRLTTWLLGFIAAVRNAVVAIGSFVSGLVSGFVNGLVAAYHGIVSAGSAIISWFQTLPSRIMAFLAALPGMLKDVFIHALEGLATAVGFSAGLLVGIFTRLPGKIADAVVTLGPQLLAWITGVWNNFLTRVVIGVTNAVIAARRLPGQILGAIKNLGPTIVSLAANAWNSLVSRFNSGISNATSTAKSLPGRIKSALGNLGSLLLNSGIDIINGLISGINRGIGKVLGLVSNLASRVKSAFNSALDIFSPSRVFIESGVNIDEGLIIGLKKKMEAVKSVATDLANTVVAPTVALPSQAGSSAQQAVQAMANGTARAAQSDASSAQFGPYNINVGNETIAQLMIDAITGNPVLISKTADEGKRTDAWAGSGRGN